MIRYSINLHCNLSDRRLLRHKRAEHVEAAKKIVSINSSVKQRDVLKALFSKLFSVSVKCIVLSLNNHNSVECIYISTAIIIDDC